LPSVTPYRSGQPVASRQSNTKPISVIKRVRIIYTCLLLLCAVFVVRLFYLQVIRHDYYQKLALRSQLKQYEVPARRGIILAHDGENITPLVLNEKKYTLYADPFYIKNPLKIASEVSKIINVDTNKISDLLKTPYTRYVVVAKKLSKEQMTKIDDLDYLGIGLSEESYRTYPQGTSAAQILGFVNSEGNGQYGLEGYYNQELAGKVGYIKAITDRRGVPLADNLDNIRVDPIEGKTIKLTIDVGIQRIAEEKLKEGLEKASSKQGSVVIIDTKNGAIKAMASYPSFDPANYGATEDQAAFKNSVVSDELEPGSIMKPLLIAAGLTSGAIDSNFSYSNKNTVTIDGLTIKNSHVWGIPEEDLQGIMQRSLNTGVVAVLQAAGGGSVNKKAREFWHDYMTNHYNFGKATGIEQSGEISGHVPDPNKGYALNFQFANTSFGQGIGVSMLQMAAAANSVINGGTYYKPHIVETVDGKQQTVASSNAISKAASDQVVKIMAQVAKVVYTNAIHDGYIVGGKTGTAEVAGPDGKYYTDRANGTFFGFVGNKQPDYAILVLSREPKITESAGIGAAEPIFANITQALINTGLVSSSR
jgi:cell division protein FtsI (penicillin-binding protein 3)